MAIDEWLPSATLPPEQDRSAGRGLRTYVRLFRRRWLLVLLTLVATIVAVVLAAVLWDPPYEARSVVQVPATWTGSLENVQLDVGYTERLLNTYVALSESGQLNREVAERLEVSDDALETSLEIPANTELLIAKATASSPMVAADGANELAGLLTEEIRDDLAGRFRAAGDSLQTQIREIDGRIAELNSSGASRGRLRGELTTQRELLLNDFNRLRTLSEAAASGVTVVDTAEPPSDRSDITWLLVLALAVGLFGAVVFVIVVDRLDETVFDVGLLATQLGHPVLGEVASAARGPKGRPNEELLYIDPQALRVAYRVKSDAPRTLMATSVQSDRESAVQVAQLCVALASTGVKVLVVDTAVGEVKLAPLLGVDADGRASEFTWTTSDSTETTVATSYDNLFCASARWAPQFIGLPEYPARALEQIRQGFHTVVVYVPALIDRAEASLLGKVIDQTVLVVGEGAISDEQLRLALRQMAVMPSEFLGVVVASRGGRRRPVRVG